MLMSQDSKAFQEDLMQEEKLHQSLSHGATSQYVPHYVETVKHTDGKYYIVMQMIFGITTG